MTSFWVLATGVAGNASGTSRFELVALEESRVGHRETLLKLGGNPALTFRLACLHCRQPSLDFLWALRGLNSRSGEPVLCRIVRDVLELMSLSRPLILSVDDERLTQAIAWMLVL